MVVVIGKLKKIDPQGRIVIPKELREKWGNEVVLIELEDRMEILPRKKPNFSKFFDIIEVKVKGEDLEKELLECL
ncbi:division/cell wall cluster transcriptional repressor MraZ [Thermococcus sp. PK]|jgi:bifunctional DNA-binding transcriptional regulator/antitoxin component of YhaV-PrlF toxin-antitoxin module|uniref:division/cell wall cluster transcriptional repressor MraZ n=1 Tax=Thermococcus sp. PK TaxID=913025 RepID=UPI0018DE1D2F|nr:division/cell wall cluster transcriptional repressor MraZ [Thermococcus sp. PK]